MLFNRLEVYLVDVHPIVSGNCFVDSMRPRKLPSDHYDLDPGWILGVASWITHSVGLWSTTLACQTLFSN